MQTRRTVTTASSVRRRRAKAASLACLAVAMPLVSGCEFGDLEFGDLIGLFAEQLGSALTALSSAVPAVSGAQAPAQASFSNPLASDTPTTGLAGLQGPSTFGEQPYLGPAASSYRKPDAVTPVRMDHGTEVAYKPPAKERPVRRSTTVRGGGEEQVVELSKPADAGELDSTERRVEAGDGTDPASRVPPGGEDDEQEENTFSPQGGLGIPSGPRVYDPSDTPFIPVTYNSGDDGGDGLSTTQDQADEVIEA